MPNEAKSVSMPLRIGAMEPEREAISLPAIGSPLNAIATSVLTLLVF
jgi:hypothetical protein